MRCKNPPGKPFSRNISSVSVEAKTPTCGAKARRMTFLGSSGLPEVARLGEKAPFRVDGEKMEPAMGVDVPELRRD